MRVEHCGDLLVEPNLLGQQPSAAISSHCSDHLQQARNNIQFSELNRLEVPLIGCKLEEYILNTVREQRGGVFGFTLKEEEWSLLNKSHLADLEPYERRKMCSLPKSFTPFTSTISGESSSVECDQNSNGSASNSISLRKCESLNPTPSQYLLNGNEPNNNSIAHPSSLSKYVLLQKSHDGFQEDEKENWLGDDGWNRAEDPAACEDARSNTINEDGVSNEEMLIWAGGDAASFQNQLGLKESELEENFVPPARYPLPQAPNVVGTIGSHPNPITSCAADQAHCHQHQDLSTSQKTPFPSTVYNFHRHHPAADPLNFGENYDEWNANFNIASLYDKNASEEGAQAYQDLLQANNLTLNPQQQGIAIPQESRFIGYANYGRQRNEDLGDSTSDDAGEEINPLSTFLSKFDDKVAAIWGQQGRSVTSNYLSTDGYISAASTPMGSSNPWGSPSSDISAIHGASSVLQQDYRYQHHAKQMSMAADALLSGGYDLHYQDHSYELEKSQLLADTSRMTIGDLTISPQKGNYNIMHSMKQYFGTAPPEGEYYIIKRNEADSSSEDLEVSLALINHDEVASGFVAMKFDKSDPQNAIKEVDWKNMTKAFDSIDLEGNECDDEWEIVEACNKERAHGYDSEDLLNSWKTHFRTVEQVESIASARGVDLLESPITAISIHQINPNLPEYRLFDPEIDGEYRVYDRPAQTIFPVKYKVFRENEKGNQTDEADIANANLPVVESPYTKLVATDWAKYVSAPPFEFSPSSLGTLPRSTTPTASDAARSTFYDCESGVDYQSTDWYNLSKGVEYSRMWGDWLSGDEASNATLVPPGGGSGGEYCDSGVGGVGSRSDFYDDMFGEYEGDYENFSGIGFSFPTYVGTTETDADFGQFQDISGFTGCDTSSILGKQGKSSKRNKTRLRPCKYFFMEGSCRRGNDCKFSHDSVTCRYWAEGSCLKGQTCPYVHCFIEGKKMISQDEYVLGSGVPEKQYHLESETDFPALSSTKNAMLSSRQPMTLGFSSSISGDGVRRLEDSLESLTVFTDSNSSVVDEEVPETQPRRLFLFERVSPIPSETLNGSSTTLKEKQNKSKPNVSNGGSSQFHRGESELWSDGTNRTLSKSKSVGDANSGNAQWSRHNSVTRSSSHSSTTGLSLGIPVKEKRKKKKH